MYIGRSNWGLFPSVAWTLTQVYNQSNQKNIKLLFIPPHISFCSLRRFISSKTSSRPLFLGGFYMLKRSCFINLVKQFYRALHRAEDPPLTAQPIGKLWLSNPPAGVACPALAPTLSAVGPVYRLMWFNYHRGLIVSASGKTRRSIDGDMFHLTNYQNWLSNSVQRSTQLRSSVEGSERIC